MIHQLIHQLKYFHLVGVSVGVYLLLTNFYIKASPPAYDKYVYQEE